MGAVDVKIEMLRRNLSQTELARRLGLSLPHLNMVVNGRRKTRWIQQAIARELGVPRDWLFGERREPQEALLKIGR
jgi:transcriptional regulator with XRE-family HTH domain